MIKTYLLPSSLDGICLLWDPPRLLLAARKCLHTLHPDSLLGVVVSPVASDLRSDEHVH